MLQRNQLAPPACAGLCGCIRNLCPSIAALRVADVLANLLRFWQMGRAVGTGRTSSVRTAGAMRQHSDHRECAPNLARDPWSVQGGADQPPAGPCRISGSREVAHLRKTQRGRSPLVRGVLKRQGASNEAGHVDGALKEASTW